MVWLGISPRISLNSVLSSLPNFHSSSISGLPMPPPPPMPWQPAQPYLRKILRPSTTASPCLANGLVPGGTSSCTTLAAADPLPSALDELLQAASSSAPQITSLDVMV